VSRPRRNSVDVALIGVTNLQYMTISPGNVASTDDAADRVPRRVGILPGDVNRSRMVVLRTVGW